MILKWKGALMIKIELDGINVSLNFGAYTERSSARFWTHEESKSKDALLDQSNKY